jgi:lipopolysaccharide transport system permease protein
MGADSAAASTPTGPREILLEPESGWVPIDLAELWQYRELVGFLAWRDVKVRYKQSLLGVAWAVLQPLLTMLVFAALFGALLSPDAMPTVAGVPYAISTYCALVPWQLFATSLQTSGNSLVANQNLITKVYFPRLVAPIAPAVAALVDFAVAFAVLIGMMLAFGIAPGAGAWALPLLTLLALATALSVSLWLSALNAIYRDVRHVLPFLVQAWMFATPVVYTTASVMAGQPLWVRALYGLNPMAGVIEGFRWALLGSAAPPLELIVGSALAVVVLLIGGLFYFRRMERRFADLV